MTRLDIGVSALLVVALGGCGSRSVANAPAPQAPVPEPAPAPAPEPEPDPPPPPRDPPDAPADVCVTTYTGECVPAPEFNDRAAALAPEYAADPGFEAQWGLESINAHLAYAHVNLLEGPDVAPGEGVTIGVIDSGIDAEHPIFAGKTIHETFLYGAEAETGDDSSHGTAVASIAAGGRTGNPNAPIGVAWGADLAVWAIPLGNPDNVYDPITAEGLASADAQFAELFQTVFDWRNTGGELDILNLSFGYDGLIGEYDEALLRENFAQTIATLAQEGSADRVILVWAAGNANGDRCGFGVPNCVDGRIEAVSVGILPGLLARIEELQGHSIAVVALSPDGGAIASFSNRCGIAADHCIAAPGQDLLFAYFGPNEDEIGFRGIGQGSGTSFAAPMVSGGLAVMKQLFRNQLSNEELVSRLFVTADRTGIYAEREIYGQGRMDLGAATSPVGVLSVPIATGGAAVMGGAALQSTGLRLGAAFGDGIQQALDGQEVMSIDGLGAPFWHGLGGFAVTTDGPSMAARLRSFLGPGSRSAFTSFGERDPGVAAPMEADVLRMPTATGSGHLALAEGAVMLSASSPSGLSASAFTTGTWRVGMPASGAAVAWRPGSVPFGLRAGWIEERETLLGSMGHGAFGSLSATTGFVGFDGGVSLGRWRLGGSGEVGLAAPEIHGGIIRDISSLATSAFALHLGTGLDERSSLQFSLSQPLRVERGAASLAVPSARTRQGEVLSESLRADLAPAHRQIDLTAQWNRAAGPGELRIGAVWSHWAGHRETLGPQLALLSGWRWSF